MSHKRLVLTKVVILVLIKHLSFEFNVHGSVHRNNILIYIQQDATLHSLFYPEIALYISVGTTTHHQEHKQLYLQHVVFVTPLLLQLFALLMMGGGTNRNMWGSFQIN